MKDNHPSLKPGRMLSLLNDFAARHVKQDLPIKKQSPLIKCRTQTFGEVHEYFCE